MYEGVAHIGIAVQDLDAAIERFTTLFGFTVGERGDGLGVRLAFLETGDTPLELLASAEPGGVIERFLERRGEGMHHIALRVRDIHAALRRLDAEGVELIDQEPRVNPLGHLVAFAHPKSVHGVLIELVQE